MDEKTVRKVAKLSRIRLEDSQVPEIVEDLTKIMDWVEQLQSVDTDGVEPMAGVGDYTLRLREDKITGGNRAKEVTQNAPKSEFDCYVVPKVVE